MTWMEEDSVSKFNILEKELLRLIRQDCISEWYIILFVWNNTSIYSVI